MKKDLSKLSEPERSQEITRDMKNRLSRVCGCLEGIKRMMDEGRDIVQILIQLYGSERAIKSVSDLMFERYLNTDLVPRTDGADETTKQKAIADAMEVLKNVRG